MRQSADLRKGNDLALLRRLHSPEVGHIFLQSQMRPAPVIIIEIRFENVAQMSLVEHDRVVETFTPDGTD